MNPRDMTNEQLAAAVDEMFNSPDFDRIKFEAARRLREYAAKLAEVERERDVWKAKAEHRGRCASEMACRIDAAGAERERLIRLIRGAADKANTARMVGSNVLATMYDALKDIGGLYDAALAPPPAEQCNGVVCAAVKTDEALKGAAADLERLRVAAQMALDELHGYADAGCSNKADHICEALRAALAPQPAEQPLEDSQPIGKCPRCGTPVYTEEGFCGVCKGGA